MEEKIAKVLRRMQGVIQEEQLKELENVLRVVFRDCKIAEEKWEICEVECSWGYDLEEYLMSKSLEGKSQGTVDRYRYELNRILLYLDKNVIDISSRDISRYLRTYKAINKVSNQTLKNVRAIYSCFFAWLKNREMIPKNPMMLVESIKVEKKIKKPFTDEERERLIQNSETLRDRALMTFLYSTAVRVSELAALNKDDIQFSSKDLIVYGKGGKERVVYFNDVTNLYMKEYLKSRGDDNPALFVTNNKPNSRLTRTGIEDIIRKIGKKAKVENAHPHRFRRTAATNALNRGMPVQEVAKLLGHEKLETTMLYCTVDESCVRQHHKKYLSA